MRLVMYDNPELQVREAWVGDPGLEVLYAQLTAGMLETPPDWFTLEEQWLLDVPFQPGKAYDQDGQVIPFNPP